jgi:hypothetical protein
MGALIHIVLRMHVICMHGHVRRQIRGYSGKNGIIIIINNYGSDWWMLEHQFPHSFLLGFAIRLVVGCPDPTSDLPLSQRQR